jgi:CubicO group peptidase (beta-lactamase class C family)
VGSIAEWLVSLGLSEYVQLFGEHGIDRSVLRDLTDRDLKDVGVLPGRRRKMLHAIAQHDDSAAAISSVPAAPMPRDDADRRQLTVMFCGPRHRTVCRGIVTLALTFGSPAFAANACINDAAPLEHNLHVKRNESDDVHSMRLQDAMQTLHVPSVSIALIAHNRIAWARAYGNATPNTLYQAASLSKTVAAVAALRLVQDRRLKLDANVNDELTSWKLPASGQQSKQVVTLRRLLSMTAGVGVPGYPGYERGSPRPSTLEIIDGKPPATSPPVRVQRVPGSAYAYSGGGYQIVQLMIEDATHTSFADAVKRLVLQPVGMLSSTYELSPELTSADSVAQGDLEDGRALPGGWREIPELAAGGLWSTPTDLARLLISISHSYAGQQPALLRRDLARAMLTRSSVGPYGLGVAVAGTGRDLVVMKRGQNVGYQAYMLIFPRSGDGIVIMTGSDNGTALETALIRRAASVCGWPALGPLMD